MNAFLRITVFHLFLSEEEIKLLEKLISAARGNGFETLKVCVQNLSEHEKYVCKRKGFREETSSDTQTVLCKHI